MEIEIVRLRRLRGLKAVFFQTQLDLGACHCCNVLRLSKRYLNPPATHPELYVVEWRQKMMIHGDLF